MNPRVLLQFQSGNLRIDPGFMGQFPDLDVFRYNCRVPPGVENINGSRVLALYPLEFS